MTPPEAGALPQVRGHPLPGYPYVEEPQKDKDGRDDSHDHEDVLPQKIGRPPPSEGVVQGERKGEGQGDEGQAPSFQSFSHGTTASQTAYPTRKE